MRTVRLNAPQGARLRVRPTRIARGRHWATMAIAALLLLAAGGSPQAQVSPLPVTGSTKMLVIGEIQSITVADASDPWSAGTITVGGKTIIVPRNLLLDLPANRTTLADLFGDAPPDCFGHQETGLAKSDTCRAGLGGGYATIAANRIECGDVIAGDVFIEKGIEVLPGIITSINYTSGYFTLDGTTMVRLNDPVARHTIQAGPGCAGFAPNCSADPRFTEDSDNYTQVFTTGYPLCIPSTVTGALRTQASNTNGVGDAFCPATNRGVTPTGASGYPVPDARHFAPIKVGDHVTVEGNFELVNGVKFLSAHTTTVASALTTADRADQPDYVFFEEIVWDVAPFARQRARFQAIGFTTLPDSQVDIYAIRVDPTTNGFREVPLTSTVNVPRAAGVNSEFGPGIFKARLDVLFDPLLGGVKPGGSFDAPCSVLQNAVLPGYPTPAGFGLSACNGGGGNSDLAAEVSVLSPMSRELIMHSRRQNPATVTAQDIQGQFAPSSQYLIPLGVGLGGLEHPDFFEFNLNATSMPYIFEGEPFNMDRRLSPGGCLESGCETTPQPLVPFPYSGVDPAFDFGSALGPAAEPAPDRIRTFFTFDSSSTTSPLTPHLLTYPTSAPACTVATPPGGGGGGGTLPPAPVANADNLTSPAGASIAFSASTLLGNDVGSGLTLTSVSPTSVAGGTITGSVEAGFSFTPKAGFSGIDTFSYTVTDSAGQTAIASVVVNVTDVLLPTVSITAPASGGTVSGLVQITANASDNVLVSGVQFFINGVPFGLEDASAPYAVLWDTSALASGTYTVSAQARDLSNNLSTFAAISLTVNGNNPPTANADLASTTAGVPVTIPVRANDTDPNGDPLTVTVVGNLVGGTAVINAGATVTFTPAAGFTGAGSFVYAVSDGRGGSSSALVSVTVDAVAVSSPVAQATVFSDGTGARTTPLFSTTAPGEVLVAFAASDGPTAGTNNQNLTVSGAGLTWTRVQRAATSRGVSEIWTATAPSVGVLTDVAITSTQSVTSVNGAPVNQSLTVVAFTSASGVGASAIRSGVGLPSVTLTTQTAGSLVYGVGNDFDRGLARTVGAGQTKVHEFLAPTGDTFWVQRVTAAIAGAGASVTVNDTAPNGDQWNLASVEIKR